ncbi:murein hydrolase activator EnvC family protein [Variovorax sp.]|uniref:murein hydrolase activator EnvC family protein n=1 Tax=Variovorax sp. TaxID=1871043 RepID=UPI002D4E7D66|nr:peptidoglycan DD-metalloendopeptidase family protein [Variovorax sp.]HYP82509.1 peptidoglycan DD-metalloendopeptidase family protein [Variovorax sp.]
MPQDQDRSLDTRHLRRSPWPSRLWRGAHVLPLAACAVLLSACNTVPLPPMTPYPATGAAGGTVPPGTVPPGTPPGTMPPGMTQPVQPGAAVPGSAVAPQAARFIRPANGPVLTRFDGQDNKGIDIGGRLGDPVLASASGRVVYVGDELRNYGNLIIVDHGDEFLTAYAYNRVVLVQERQSVTQGQKIGEIGRNPEGTSMLHFEIRKSGQPVDPEPYLAGMQP